MEILDPVSPMTSIVNRLWLISVKELDELRPWRREMPISFRLTQT